MKRILKGVFLAYVLARLLLEGRLTVPALAVLLTAAGLIVLHERFWQSPAAVLLQLVPGAVGLSFHPAFVFLLCPSILDLVYQRLYPWLIVVPAVLAYHLPQADWPAFLLVCTLAGLAGYVLRDAETKAKALREGLDEERRLRYDLEQTRDKLLQAAAEAAHLAEMTERNRIAREVHDSVGHKIAGILIKLQAAAKLKEKDHERAGRMLDESIAGLAGAVTLLRETVHNLKPRAHLGVDYLKTIVNGFTFCPVDAVFTGDFNQVPAGHLEILAANLREALTNTAKHSRATRVEVKVETNDSYTRLYIRDDGIGCAKITEGLGLSGMRERLANLGGSFSVSSDRGFLLVCVLPRAAREESRAAGRN